jgi:hypothetical protein
MWTVSVKVTAGPICGVPYAGSQCARNADEVTPSTPILSASEFVPDDTFVLSTNKIVHWSYLTTFIN